MGREKFGDADTVRRLVRKCHELDLAHVLVSYQASTALGGPIYIARVIRMADGALLALRTGPAQGGAVALRPLLARAIADGLQAAANHPLR